MKRIEAISTWVNGQSVTATIFNLCPITGGQLYVSSNFYYQLLDENKVVAADGNLFLDGEDYQLWGTNDNYPYEWAAGKLNLTIIGDWVEHVVEHTPKEQEFINSVLEQLPEEVVNDLTGEDLPSEK